MSEPAFGLRKKLLQVAPWLRETSYLSELRDLHGSGLATACGVMVPLSHVVRDRLNVGSSDGLAEVFAFVDSLMSDDRARATPEEAELDDAVATCFLENIAEPFSPNRDIYTPLLGPRSRTWMQSAMPDCLART